MRVRVRGVPYRSDNAYWRLGHLIPCDSWIELEVEAGVYQALAKMPELEVVPLDSPESVPREPDRPEQAGEGVPGSLTSSFRKRRR